MLILHHESMLANTSQPLRFSQHEEHAHNTGAGNRERGKISYQMKNHAEIKRAGCGWGWEGGGVGSGRKPLLNSNFINSYIEQIPK